MNNLRIRIEKEFHIVKLKSLVEELNKMPDKSIKGYSMSQIEELREIALDKDISIKELSEINSLSGLKDIARLIGIKGFSRFKAAQKEELRSLIISNVIKRNESSIIVEEKEYKENTKTSTLSEDWNNLEFDTETSSKCLKGMGIVSKNQIGKGSFGKSYAIIYNNTPAIVKILKFPGYLRMEGFKWECIINERAANIGVGPEILDKKICMGKKGPESGVLIMSRCTPLSKDITTEECLELYNLIDCLHQNGISHRDIGLRNIMKNGNRLVIIDYGLALAFPGTVPEEYKILDHLSLAYDCKSYYNYLKSIKSEAYMAKMDEYFRDSVKRELLTVKYFPECMLKTLPFDIAANYLNNVDGNSAVIVDRALKARYK